MSSEIAIRNMDDLARVADMFARSGLFKDTADAAQAGVKIMAGQAWGIDAFSSMVGIALIQGKPVIGAGIMAAKVKGHPKYDFIVKRLDESACEIEFFEGARSLGVSTFTIEDARQAGYASKQNYRATPRNMLFARALSNGVRWFTPDVFSSSVYTPEDFNVDGEVSVEVVSRPERPAERPAPALEAPTPEPEPEAPQEAPQAAVEAAPLATPKQRALVIAGLTEQGLSPEDSLAFLSWLTGRAITNTKELSRVEASRVIGWKDTPDAWENALADYAVAASGGPPDEPDWSDLKAPA